MHPTLTIVLVGSFVAASCALVGSFLVLRKMALLGDAISHAVLPGIALAFLLSGSRNPLAMLIGAGLLGVLTVFLVELANRTQLLKPDASIGVVFPALFSIGVILISRYAYQVDLDLDCVLHGEIAYAPWDPLLVTLGGMTYDLGPRALWINGLILVLNAIVVGLFYKELKLSTFDGALAMSLGFSPVLMHYVLMTMVSVTVVGAFESVGAILVVAMLIVPAATAKLLTVRLSRMLLLATLFGVSSATLGYALARWWDASIAGCMATVTGIQFLAALLFAPTNGLVARTLRHRSLTRAMSEQLLLLHLHDEQAASARSPKEIERRFGWSYRELERVLDRLERRSWIIRSGDDLRVSQAGLAVMEQSGHLPLRHA